MEGTEAMGDNNVLYVKVMTDEQMEVLRKQISVYATICEGLVEMHKAVTAQQDSLAGMRLGNLYCDPLTMPGAHKITARQRWTPTPMQLQILERLFEQGNGTPSKQKIKDITLELSQHGQISETNVYNWFQNRRARSKRKQVVSQANNTESEADGDEDSPSGDKEKKPKSEKSQTSIYMNDETADFDQDTNNRVGTGVYMMPNDNNSRSSGSSAQLSFYDNILSNPRYAGMEHYVGKMSSPGSFSHLQF